MLKIFLISLVLFGLCFIDTKNGFAITAEDSLNKNNTQNIKQTEPYFDLPKKDAKEQCKEVERVRKECKNVLKDGKMYKCGNIYVRSFYFYPLLDLSYGGLEPYLVIDQFGNYIASNIFDKMIFALKHKDNKIFETRKIDLEKSIKKDITIFYNQNCEFTKINFYQKN